MTEAESDERALDIGRAVLSAAKLILRVVNDDGLDNIATATAVIPLRMPDGMVVVEVREAEGSPA